MIVMTPVQFCIHFNRLEHLTLLATSGLVEMNGPLQNDPEYECLDIAITCINNVAFNSPLDFLLSEITYFKEEWTTERVPSILKYLADLGRDIGTLR